MKDDGEAGHGWKHMLIEDGNAMMVALKCQMINNLMTHNSAKPSKSWHKPTLTRVNDLVSKSAGILAVGQ